MEGEVYGEVVLENVLQGDGGFESHVDISQGICGIKTKPIVGLPRGRSKISLERTKKKNLKVRRINPKRLVEQDKLITWWRK